MQTYSAKGSCVSFIANVLCVILPFQSLDGIVVSESGISLLFLSTFLHSGSTDS